MTNILPAGKIAYQENYNGLSINGFIYTNDNISQSAPIIADICFDRLGQKNFEEYTQSLSDTGFSPITTILPTVRDWQVGEGFAEAYLSTHALL